jgi:hypothetical protein
MKLSGAVVIRLLSGYGLPSPGFGEAGSLSIL